MGKVCLLGASLGTANMGVSALAISFVKIIRHIDKEMDVSLLVGAKQSGFKQIDLGETFYNLKIVNYRMSPKARLQENLLWILFLSILYRIIRIEKFRKQIIESNPWLREIEQSIFVGSIHGGDSFSDIYGLGRYYSTILPDVVTLLLNKPLVFLPQTYGPYKHSLTKHIARFLIMRSCIVLCRDKNGPDTVRKIIGSSKLTPKILFCPDVAFFLHRNSVPGLIFKDQSENKKSLVGINVNGLLYKGGYNQNNMFGLNLDYGKLITGVIQNFLLKSDANITLIPHNNAPRGNIESDLEACEEVIKNISGGLKDRIHIMELKHSPSEIKGVISKCDFFIGSRMHACIAALSSGIPAIGIAYSKKFMGVFESIGAKDLVLDARSVEMETALNLIWRHFENRDLWKTSLKARIRDLQKRIIDVFEGITKELAG